MATSTLEFDCPDGLTLTAQLYALGADTALISAACTERTNDKGSYTCSIVNIATGTYKLRIKNASNQTIARGLLEHTNAAVNERPVEVTAAQVNSEVLDVVGTDTLVAGVAITESLRRIGAITSGIVSGGGTGVETFKDYAQSASTIVITVDTSGNRSVISYN